MAKLSRRERKFQTQKRIEEERRNSNLFVVLKNKTPRVSNVIKIDPASEDGFEVEKQEKEAMVIPIQPEIPEKDLKPRILHSEYGWRNCGAKDGMDRW